MNTTYEEASKCPKCTLPGQQVKLTPAPKGAKLPPGTKVAMIYCRNDRCKWFDTPWTIQINADGSVPPPQDHSKTPKLYMGFENHDAEAAELIAALKRNAAAELLPGAEISRPR